MGAGSDDAAASPTSATSGSGPADSVQRLKEKLREAARRREKLMEQQREKVARLRTLHRELDESVNASVGADNGSSAAPKGAPSGDSDEEDLREGLKQLQAEVDKQLEAEQALAEGVNTTKHASEEGSEPACRMQSSPQAANGKRKREDATEDDEDDDQPPSPCEASEAIRRLPLQPVELAMFGRGALDLDSDEAAARSLAAAFRVVTRYIMVAGESVAWTSIGQAFEAYTGRKLDEDIRDETVRSFARLGIALDESSSDSDGDDTESGAEAQPWLPGTQYLDTPSLALSPTTGGDSLGEDAAALQAYIEIEKQLLTDVDNASLLTADSSLGNGPALKALFTRATFASAVACGEGTVDIHAFLAQRLGRRSWQLSLTYRTFREFTGVFLQKEREVLPQWMEQDRGSSLTPQRPGVSRGNHTAAASSGFDKPFSLVEDSITRQFGRHQESGARQQHAFKRRRKADPMKMMCPYELNGICNDENCAYLHARDFSEQGEESEGGGALSTSGDGARAHSLSADNLAFLSNFTATRRKYLAKWPVITPTTFAEMEATVENVRLTEQSVDQRTPPANNDRASDTPARQSTSASVDADGWTEYLVLDAQEDVMGDLVDTDSSRRYYGGGQQDTATDELEQLQRRVEEQPDDSGAWLQLAIRQLNLGVPSDDGAERPRFQSELLALSKVLHYKARASTRATSIDEQSVKKCLHVLSRALEVEANLYCEAVWLLYLHLYWQISDQEHEEETVEKAVQFVTGSHRLLLRYLSVLRFDKVSKATAMYGRVLQMLCQMTPRISDEAAGDGDQAGEDTTVPRSISLSAVALALCATLSQAGATSWLHQFLDAMVYGEDGGRAVPEAFSWCATVRAHLSGHDLIVLHLIYGHVLVFDRLPACAEDWLASAGCEGIRMACFVYTIESFRQDFRAAHGSTFPSETRAKLLDVYDHAYEYSSTELTEDAALAHAAGDVVLNNWMILIAELYLLDDDASVLASFFSDRLDTIQAFPAAAFTASKLLQSHLDESSRAQQLILDMLSRSDRQHFGAALHFYLFASNFLPDLTVALDMTLIDVMAHLATAVGADAEVAKTTIMQMKASDAPIAKMRELQGLLSPMLSLWMDQLAAATASPGGPTPCPDVYVGLDICHLMARLVQPSEAIAGLDWILQSPRFWALDVDSRQLAWSLRFLLQVNQWEMEALPLVGGERSVQSELTHLFKRYMGEMSESSEFARQVEARISAETSTSKAVIECLYPRQHQSLLSDVSLELFQLCSVIVPAHDKPHFFSSFADELATEPRFALAFADVAGREWEWRSARAALKRALVTNSMSSWHADILQTTVAGDVKHRRMKAASTLLAAELATHPSSLATWQLVVSLEILLGNASPARAETIARELVLRGLPLSCNAFGDAAVLEHEGALAPAPHAKRTDLSWRALRLPVFPRSMLLHTELVSLDLSGNQIVELPSDLDRLLRLETLNVSENALMTLPDSLARLPSLQSLNVAHNNLTSLPIASWAGLRALKTVDCCYNMLSEVKEAAALAVESLLELKLDGNAIPEDQVRKVTLALEHRRADSAATKPSPSAALNESATAMKPSPSIDLTAGSGDVHIDLTEDDAGESEGANVDTDADGSSRHVHDSQNIFELASNLGFGDSSDAVGAEVSVQPPVAASELDSAPASQSTSRLADLPVTPAVVAIHKLSEYMVANGLASRAEVRTANPSLWAEFADATVDVHSSLGSCVLCQAPNSAGAHQRLNAVTMCLDCIEDMTARLRAARQA